MKIEDVQLICRNLPGTTEDIKWDNHLCFNVGDKMFFVLGLDTSPTTCSFKADDEEFNILSTKEGCMPAPYLARYKWIHVDDLNRMGKKEWERLILKSYELVKKKLPKKKLNDLGLIP
jgi:predicted DNA-binding protein (MmcQ/YjbR family)